MEGVYVMKVEFGNSWNEFGRLNGFLDVFSVVWDIEDDGYGKFFCVEVFNFSVTFGWAGYE